MLFARAHQNQHLLVTAGLLLFIYYYTLMFNESLELTNTEQNVIKIYVIIHIIQ